MSNFLSLRESQCCSQVLTLIRGLPEKDLTFSKDGRYAAYVMRGEKRGFSRVVNMHTSTNKAFSIGDQRASV